MLNQPSRESLPSAVHDEELLVEQIFGQRTRILSYLRYKLRDRADLFAEDLCQDVLFKAVRRISTFHREANIKTWLYSIAINTLIDFFRVTNKEWKGRVDLSEEVLQAVEINTSMLAFRDGSLDDNPEKKLTQAVDVEAARVLVYRLPPELREPFLKREVYDLSYDEIAEDLNIPVGTVKSRIFRAREALGLEVTESGVDLDPATFQSIADFERDTDGIFETDFNELED